MTALSLASTVLLSYLAGAIPFGYLIARWRGVDILKQGSGNIGATNVGRVLGRPFGILVFLLDFAKGALPALLAKCFANSHDSDLPADSLPVAAAAAAFLGHLYPIYLRFRGGRGVATAAGAVSMLLPGPALAALLTWFAVALASRYVSLASLFAAAVLCVVRLVVTPQPWSADQRVLTLFCLLASSLIFLRHRANIGRLLHGNENRLKETAAMFHVSKILHVLALGLWFGTVVFFSFVVGLNLFGTFERVAAEAPGEREVWFPMWTAYDGPSPDLALPNPLRKEQGTRAAGVALVPLFNWYFGIQAGCAVLATATALWWGRRGAGRVHSLRAGILLAALVTVVLGWRLMLVVEDMRESRNGTFDAMVRQSTLHAEDVRPAIEARQAFVRWHLASLGVNMATVLLIAIAMAQAAYLPVLVREEKTSEMNKGVKTNAC
ncbi:MAG TPA: glycerol-3-phosphate 1-O-acyltransferase PlsY [Gemmataceae bacterium]|nr:glycerol-3-phosphate 1-O-acyltransferase PlsY [Gemmataceae bacterium]